MSGTATRRDRKDPTGRLDVLFLRIVDRSAEANSSPLVRGVYDALKPLLEQTVKEKFGPRRKLGRIVKKAIKSLPALREGVTC